MDDIKLTKSPISVCLIQLRFSPIESLEKVFIPIIQEQYRKKGLPFFEKKKVQKLYSKSSTEFELREEWVFLFYDANKTELVQILTNEFDFHVYSYPGYEEVKKRYFELLNVFSSICDFNNVSITSLGLRYTNSIEGNEWREYLDSKFFGVKVPNKYLKSLNNEFVSAQDIAEVDLGDDDTSLFRVSITQNEKGITIPTNVARIEPEKEREGVLITILDLDHIVRFKPGVVIGGMDTYLTKMHDITHDMFFELISEKAKKKWH